MIRATINGRRIDITSGWHEMDTETYQRIKAIEEPTLISLFSAVVGFDYQAVAESSDSDLEFAMYQVTSYIVNTAGEEYFRKADPPQFFQSSAQRGWWPQPSQGGVIHGGPAAVRAEDDTAVVPPGKPRMTPP